MQLAMLILLMASLFALLPADTVDVCVPFPSSWPERNWERVKVSGWGRQAGFTMRLPPGWQVNELPSVDSYRGEVAGDGVRLVFDYGSHPWDLSLGGEPPFPYDVWYEEISGAKAKLMVYAGDETDFAPIPHPRGSLPYIGGYFGPATGVYFEDARDGFKFSMVGRGLEPDHVNTVIGVFRSLSFRSRSYRFRELGLDPECAHRPGFVSRGS